MNKQCQQCSKTFEIFPEDQEFYDKIEVSEPTWCPSCREMRRMAWCNEGTLYPDKCAKCNKSIISQFSPNDSRLVWCVTCWWADDWDPRDFGRDIDFSRSFFEQFHELELSVPHACVSVDDISENSEYTHHAGQNKNCFMIFHATYNEQCYYGYGVKKSKDCVDVHNCFESELCYECVDVYNGYNLGWSQDCFDCSNSRFLYDCRGVEDSFMCVGLRTKRNCFLKEQLTAEEYAQRMADLNTGSLQEVQQLWKQFQELKEKHPRRFTETNKVNDVMGDHLFNAAYVRNCYDCRDVEHVAYCSQLQLTAKDCYDVYQFGIDAELIYEAAMTGTNVYNIRFSYLCIFGSSDLTYCIECYNSAKESFGCFGLRGDKFCILNKQYDESQYSELKQKLIEHMKKTGEWGEFFPIQYSQSAYNETIAQLWFPKTKQEVEANGWRWQDNLPGTYGKETLTEIPDDILAIDDAILQDILACVSCNKNYTIIKQEFDFYKRSGYPLPRYCFECRRKARMDLRNPRSLWHRQCMCTQPGHDHGGRKGLSDGSGGGNAGSAQQCPREFETTYSPDRKEIVYCEKCYQKEIY